MLLIVLGTLLLKLPAATHTPITWLQALFTATSAVTVTGLAVVDTAQFTFLGQLVLAGLIQAGGLGFMAFAVAAVLSLRVSMGFYSQMVAREALGQTSFQRIGETARAVMKFAVFFELCGFVLLTLFFLQYEAMGAAIWAGFFYTISAFNNAGFALSADSLVPYADHVGINVVITLLIMAGGLGFWVLMDIQKSRRWKRFNINTKLVLLTTVLLNGVAWVLLWLLERDNPATLGLMETSQQWLAAWFQAVSPRTAGFNTIAIDQLNDASTVLMLFLMFVGGGSVSTASGLKVGTFAVLCLATLSFLRRQPQVMVFRRTIADEQVKKAMALFSITLLLIGLGVFVLTVVEAKHPFIDVVFEVVSALSTVGLSRGLTSSLSPAGEVVIMVMMFVGRVGPLTLAYLITLPKGHKIRYPQENIQIG